MGKTLDYIMATAAIATMGYSMAVRAEEPVPTPKATESVATNNYDMSAEKWKAHTWLIPGYRVKIDTSIPPPGTFIPIYGIPSGGQANDTTPPTNFLESVEGGTLTETNVANVDSPVIEMIYEGKVPVANGQEFHDTYVQDPTLTAQRPLPEGVVTLDNMTPLTPQERAKYFASGLVGKL